jgi:hypothetical protein
MKKLVNPIHLPLWTLLAGGIGLLLRVWLMTGGVDDKGFIRTGHVAGILLFLLVIGAMVALFFLTKNLVEAGKYEFNFPVSEVSCYGAFVAAAGIGISSFVDIFLAMDALEVISALAGVAAAGLLVLIGIFRRKGTPPSLLTHIGICVYLMLRLVSYYRHWSADPQILDYCFQLVATACLMLTTYQRATFDAREGKRRPYAFLNLTTIFFSCISLVGWSNILFFLSVIVWQMTDHCSLIPLKLDDISFGEEDSEC